MPPVVSSAGTKRRHDVLGAAAPTLLDAIGGVVTERRSARAAASSSGDQAGATSRGLLAHGQALFAELVHFGLSKSTRCNMELLALADKLEKDNTLTATKLLRDANFDASRGHGNFNRLRTWRVHLRQLYVAKEKNDLANAGRRPATWVLGPSSFPAAACHWTPPRSGRRESARSPVSSTSAAIQLLRPALASAGPSGAVVRADGSQVDVATADILSSWPYISVHFMHEREASTLANHLQDWPSPPWFKMERTTTAAEAILTVFLTGDDGSRCSLHRDNVNSAWAILAGWRELYVLPPWATGVLSDVNMHAGREADRCFSDYDPWADERRSKEWRRCVLNVGDWVFMPAGWWHVRCGEGLAGIRHVELPDRRWTLDRVGDSRGLGFQRRKVGITVSIITYIPRCEHTCPTTWTRG